MSCFNKEMSKRIKEYQKMYHDVDINMIHEKITLLTTENDFYKNLSYYEFIIVSFYFQI